MAPPPTLTSLVAEVEGDAPTADPLDRLATASAAAAEMAATGDALVGHFVDRCRRAGLSWAQISTALGVTKQAAHKRFAGPVPHLERFTARAQQALAEASTAARALGHTFVGPEHLLLGLLAVPGTVAERLLTGSGLTQEGVAAAVVEGHPPGDGSDVDPPHAPAAAEVLAGAVAEALSLGHNYVGTEHLVLALLRDPETLAARILTAAGVTANDYRAKVLELLAGYTG